MKRAFRQAVARHLAGQDDPINAEIVTEEDVARLPEPVQRYMGYTKVIGKKKVSCVRLKQKG